MYPTRDLLRHNPSIIHVASGGILAASAELRSQNTRCEALHNSSFASRIPGSVNPHATYYWIPQTNTWDATRKKQLTSSKTTSSSVDSHKPVMMSEALKPPGDVLRYSCARLKYTWEFRGARNDIARVYYEAFKSRSANDKSLSLHL